MLFLSHSAFFLSFDKAGPPKFFCTTVVMPMMIEEFHVMFFFLERFYKNLSLMAIEP